MLIYGREVDKRVARMFKMASVAPMAPRVFLVTDSGVEIDTFDLLGCPKVRNLGCGLVGRVS